ncbi:MAG: T9SS type A sorting domain-containing protein [Flavobacteriales bacterium]|nr:T9SS type A sorting domain-containing protein [Flavobacteriales bacterium]
MNQLATPTAANSKTRWISTCMGMKMKFVSLFLLSILGLSGIANAQFTNLYSFSATPDGSQPNADLVSDGTFLYGMTTNGGTNSLGTIFKIKPDGTGYEKLLDFDGATNGSSPYGSLITDGTFLYGMTTDGGINGLGTIFKIMNDGTGYVKLLDFEFAGVVNAYGPRGSLVSDGTFLYGMTLYGGAGNYGNIFKIGTDGTGYQEISDFGANVNGGSPIGSLLLDGAYLYGMAYNGGTNGAGTVFKLMTNGSGLETVLDFDGTSNGSNPYGSLISDGTYLYGMATSGGTNNMGTIFKIMPNGTGYVKLLDFDGTTNGMDPRGDLVFDGTFLYGMTADGGLNDYGTMFKIMPDGTGYEKLLDFSGPTDGNTPYGSLISVGNSLYGMTFYGGANWEGNIFKYGPCSPTYSLLTHSSCASSYTLNSITYTASGNYTQTITNVAGCDSVIDLELSLNSPSASALTLSTCSNNYTLNSITYNSSGTYTQTLTNFWGCDSVVTIDLTLNAPSVGLPGELDFCFDPGTGANEYVSISVPLPDGKILIGGNFTEYNGTPTNRIARLNTDGTLDNTFDTGTGASHLVKAILLQPDGKIIIAGWFTEYNGTPRNCIARLNADGSLDNTFDPGIGPNEVIQTALLQPDGKIIIAGFFTEYAGTAKNYIARLNADGSLDSSFGLGTGANNRPEAIRLQPDGKIIIAGTFTEYDGIARNYIARIHADGSLDNSFDPGSGANSGIEDVMLQPDGKIIIGGWFTSYNGTGINRIARINSDGSLDNSFNVGTAADALVFCIALQTDGKIIIGGNFAFYNGTGRNRIARINSDGSLDNTFDPGTGVNLAVHSATLQPDGKVIIGGQFTDYDGTNRNRIARVHGDLTVAIDNQELSDANINLFPNPTQGELTLQAENLNGAIVTVYNSTGQLIMAQKVAGGNQHLINLSGQASGLYIIEVKQQSGSKRLMVSKQ